MLKLLAPREINKFVLTIVKHKLSLHLTERVETKISDTVLKKASLGLLLESKNVPFNCK